jgi:hypothetical protein
VRFLWTLALCACAASAFGNPAPSRPADDAASVSTAFADRVRAYVKLPAAAQRDVRHGDIFAPEVAEEFQKIIRKAFRGKDARNMRRTIREADPIKPTILRVNDVYPEEIPLTTMPPTLLRRLPAVPMELAYRIIGRALVLQDIKTNLIVDFIPDAIPRVR